MVASPKLMTITIISFFMLASYPHKPLPPFLGGEQPTLAQAIDLPILVGCKLLKYHGKRAGAGAQNPPRGGGFRPVDDLG
jgi:hypothetical protein